MILGCCSIVVLASLLLLSAELPAGTAGDTSSWGFSLDNLDRTCKPCDDFYEFAMGGWMKANPIPPEYSTWGTFTRLRDNNLTALHTILEAATKSTATPGSNEQKISDFYSSCMDTSAIEAAGLKPIAGDLATLMPSTTARRWTRKLPAFRGKAQA